jgi:hypothetical protein
MFSAFLLLEDPKIFPALHVTGIDIEDHIEKLGDLGESRCFAGHKTDEKHWKRTRKKNY